MSIKVGLYAPNVKTIQSDSYTLLVSRYRENEKAKLGIGFMGYRKAPSVVTFWFGSLAIVACKRHK